MSRDQTRESFSDRWSLRHWIWIVVLWTACAPRQAIVKTGFNFSQVRRISIDAFTGPGAQPVADEFVKHLIADGLDVSDARHPGQLILKGIVTDYKPNHALMVFLGNTTLVTTGGQTLVVNNPVVSPGSSQLAPEGAAAGAQNPQLASVSALVGVTAKLIDPATGNAVWIGTYSYEALDLPTSLQIVVGALTQSMRKVLPASRRPA